jgi:ATP-dependent RNA helicase RhlE
MPFRALGLGPKLLRAIQEAGYTEPTPIQIKAIPEVLAGHDVIGIAQTGTGKTAAFVLPILQRFDERGSASGRRGMRALVLTPTRELAAQIEENVRDYGRHNHIRHATIIGGVGERPQIDALRRGVDIVVATPGRLIDLMGQGHVVFSDVEVLVLDEADRMLDMGFIPAIRRIVKALPSRRQTLLFSASLSAEIEKITSEFLRSPRTVQIGRRANPAESVAQFVYEVPKHLKLALLIHLLQDSSLDSVLVFSRTKHGADKIAKRLVAAGINTSTLHSNRSQNQRIQALKSFKSGAARVLVATDIAARGIDVEGISHVINFDFPMHSEDYVHRIGRTGRAHAIGDAISFVTPEDHASLRSLEKFIGRGIPRHRAESFDYSKQDERPAQQPESRQVAVRRTPGGEAPRHHLRKPQARPGFAPRIDRGPRERIGTPSLRGMGPRLARRRP